MLTRMSSPILRSAQDDNVSTSGHTERRQLPGEPVAGGEVNGPHAQRAGRHEIRLPIVDEHGAVGWRLRDPERQPVDLVRRLGTAEPAGGEERVEDLAQAEVLDAIQVELQRLVVERHHSISPAGGDAPGQLDRRLVRPALGLHEGDELLPAEVALLVEHRGAEVLVQRHTALLEGADSIPVLLLELDAIQPEALHRTATLRRAPGVSPEHAADVEEDVADAHRFRPMAAMSAA